MYSFREGYREAVLFPFYKDGKVLLEDRGLGFEKEAFFPNGSIEVKDKESEQYIHAALFREINEEFGGKITVNKMVHLGELKVDEIHVVFYIFCIIEWQGEFPNYIIEPGEAESQIAMFSLERAREIVKYDSAHEVLDRIEKMITNM